MGFIDRCPPRSVCAWTGALSSSWLGCWWLLALLAALFWALSGARLSSCPAPLHPCLRMLVRTLPKIEEKYLQSHRSTSMSTCLAGWQRGTWSTGFTQICNVCVCVCADGGKIGANVNLRVRFGFVVYSTCVLIAGITTWIYSTMGGSRGGDQDTCSVALPTKPRVCPVSFVQLCWFFKSSVMGGILMLNIWVNQVIQLLNRIWSNKNNSNKITLINNINISGIKTKLVIWQIFRSNIFIGSAEFYQFWWEQVFFFFFNKSFLVP